MPIDDFGLSPDLSAEPLDVSQFGGTPPFVPQQPQSPLGGVFDKGQAKSLAPLLAILPIVAKRGGQGAIAALLRGFQGARTQQQQQGRLTAQDQRLAAQDERAAANQRSLDEVRKATLANQAAQRRAGYLKQFEGALGDIDDPAVLEHLVNLYGAQGQAFGVDRNALQQYAAAAAPPTKLQKRAAEKRIAALKAQFGQDKWAQEGAKFLHDLPGGERVSFQDLLTRAGYAADPNAPAQAPTDSFEGNTPEKAHLAAYARRLNKPVSDLTDIEIQRATKAFRQSDDRPQPQATILIQTVDETGRPVQRLVPKQAGTEFATAPSASQQTSIAEQEAGLATIGRIEQLFKPEYVGPIAGRATKAQMAIPGAPDVAPDVATFHAEVAGLRNEIIKLLSGAAVSASEEGRMRAQLPDVTDKPSVFQAKLAQTRRNRDSLLARMKARGATAPAAAPTRPAVGTKMRNKRTGDIAYVTGYTAEGKPIFSPNPPK